MVAVKAEGRARWSSRAGFVLAAAGSAIGLANLWRFPSETGANGGGAFVLIYLACVLFIGAPLLLSEMLIGRHGQSSAVESANRLARRSGASPGWAAFAWLGMVASFLVLTFYSVVAGWSLHYIASFGRDFLGAAADGRPFAGAFADRTPAGVRQLMPDLLSDLPRMIGYHLLFMAITVFVVVRGVRGGIEAMARWMMPALFLLLIAIAVYAALTGDFGAAADFLFKPDFEAAFNPHVLNSALGQVFFSLGLASGTMITYGSYASAETNLARTAGQVALIDTAVALLAGLAIFPIVFSVGLSPDAGPTLMFQTIPAAFHEMPGGALVGASFFTLVFFAALTSSVSMLEVPTAWASERFGLRRGPVAAALGVGAFLIGLLSVFAFNIWSEVRPLAFVPGFEEANWFAIFDGLTSRVMLPLAGLVTAIFIGWVAERRLVEAETGLSGFYLRFWRFLVAWLCPLAVGLILLWSLFPQLLASG